MGKHNLDAIILPTFKEDFSDLAHQLLGVHPAMAKRWCKSDKLNVSMVFKYFSKKDVPLARAKRSYHLNAFCLCILARFFLVHETPRMDLGIPHVVKNLGSGSPIAIILAETLNGLNVVHRKEVYRWVEKFLAKTSSLRLGRGIEWNFGQIGGGDLHLHLAFPVLYNIATNRVAFIDSSFICQGAGDKRSWDVRFI